MRALLFGTVAEGEGYPRIRGLTAGLERLGVEVGRLVRPVDRRFQAQARGSLVRAGLQSMRLLAARRELWRSGRALPRPDLVLVGYPAHPVADLPGRIWPGVPVLIDFFLSAYETAVLDRRLVVKRSLAARFLRWSDPRAAVGGTLVLTDTPQMADYVAELTGVARERFRVVPCGDPDAPAYPCVYRPVVPGETLRVVQIGTGIPLHGLEHVIDAVRRTPGIELTLVGGGSLATRLLEQAPCARVRRHRAWIDRKGLAVILRASHLALGVFGASPKADRVVPLKVYHALAEGCPVLTGEAAAIRTLFDPERELWTCARGSAPALAEALGRAAREPERLARLARAGAEAFSKRFSLPAQSRRLGEILAELGLSVRHDQKPEKRMQGDASAPSVAGRSC